ncbi:MAG: hypothetical protein ACP5NK_08025, partial [Thermoplasmata archaeon]
WIAGLDYMNENDDDNDDDNGNDNDNTDNDDNENQNETDNTTDDEAQYDHVDQQEIEELIAPAQLSTLFY